VKNQPVGSKGLHYKAVAELAWAELILAALVAVV